MWWKKKKREKGLNGSSAIGTRLRQKVYVAQRRLADKLNSKSAHWNNRHKIIFLVLVCTVLAGGNLLMVHLAPSKSTIRTSNTATVQRQWKLPAIDPAFNGTDSATFMELRTRLLQLLATDSGTRKVAAFEAARPGFLDSVLYVERQIFPTLPPIQLPSNIKSTPHE